MGALFEQRVTLGQAKGPEVELIVSGDEFYARYGTEEGYPVVYDDALGLFAYALLRDGRFVSSSVPLTSPPPRGAVPHAEESAEVRLEKAGQRAKRQNPP